MMALFNFGVRKHNRKRQTTRPYMSIDVRRVSAGIWLSESASSQPRPEDFRFSLGRAWTDENGKRRYEKTLRVGEFRHAVLALSRTALLLSDQKSFSPQLRTEFEEWWAYLDSVVVSMDRKGPNDTARPPIMNGAVSKKRK